MHNASCSSIFRRILFPPSTRSLPHKNLKKNSPPFLNQHNHISLVNLSHDHVPRYVPCFTLHMAACVTSCLISSTPSPGGRGLNWPIISVPIPSLITTLSAPTPTERAGAAFFAPDWPSWSNNRSCRGLGVTAVWLRLEHIFYMCSARIKYCCWLGIGK